jgi:predicted kinase
MRKWMRDRLKRPKKNAEAGKTGPAQAPLQPAFYDADVPEARAIAAKTEVNEPHPVEGEASEPEFEVPVNERSDMHAEAPETSADRPQRPAGNGDPRRRRRRGRGGRGRGGAQTARLGATPNAPAESGQPAPSAEVNLSDLTKTTPAAAPKASKGTVVLAIGLPGSGKSSWFKRHNVTPLSSDMLRALLFDDPTEQRFQDLIFSNLRSMLKARLVARRPLNYVDATNLTPHERQSWIKLGHDYGYEVQAVFFDVPLEVCLERNHKRERVVADDVMRRMSAKLRAPTFDEGFSKITVVRVKRKE